MQIPPTITTREFPHLKGKRIVVDFGLVNEKRLYKLFKTQTKADTWASEKTAELRAHGTSSQTLTEEQRIVFTAAQARLAEAGCTITEAVDDFLSRRKRLKENITVQELVHRALLKKEVNGARDPYVKGLGSAWRSFIAGKEHRAASSITHDEVMDWLEGNGWSRKSRQVHYGNLGVLFSWGIQPRQGYVLENPCAVKVDWGRVDQTEIESLSIPQIHKLLECIVLNETEGNEDHFDFLWFAVLGIYTGLRTGELFKLKRSAVNLAEKIVMVTGHDSKTRERRVVDIPDNAVAWLKLDTRKIEMVVPKKNFKRRWRRCREDAGLLNRRARMGRRPWKLPPPDPLLRWPRNAMRHTFASYHYAQHQNAPLLKSQLGHSDRRDETMLVKHYRGVRTRKEAAEYYKFRPRRKLIDARRAILKQQQIN